MDINRIRLAGGHQCGLLHLPQRNDNVQVVCPLAEIFEAALASALVSRNRRIIDKITVPLYAVATATPTATPSFLSLVITVKKNTRELEKARRGGRMVIN